MHKNSKNNNKRNKINFKKKNYIKECNNFNNESIHSKLLSTS